MKILKFGQSTLKDTSSIAKVLDIIVQNPESIVVVSPLFKVSNRLEQIGKLAMVGNNSYKPILQEIEDEHFAIAKHFVDIKHQAKVIAGLKVMLNDLEEILYGVYLLWELSPRTKDHISTYGVKLSAYLMAECLKSKGVEANYFDIQKIIITNDVYGNAEVDKDTSLSNIKEQFGKIKGISVVTGSIGSTYKGESSNFGKSGSSFTSALFANALNAKSIEIYTDRDGILNTDPTLVHNAFSLKEISYAEVMEMSNFGNSFVYPPAIQPAIIKNIPITIRILKVPGEFVKRYEISIESISDTTESILERIRQRLIDQVNFGILDITTDREHGHIEERLEQTIKLLIGRYFPESDDVTKEFLTTYLIQKSLGLGNIEMLMGDNQLEEIVINDAREPVWVYHKEFGWLRTNVR